MQIIILDSNNKISSVITNPTIMEKDIVKGSGKTLSGFSRPYLVFPEDIIHVTQEPVMTDEGLETQETYDRDTLTDEEVLQGVKNYKTLVELPYDRWLEETGGIEINGMNVDTSRDSQSLLAGAAVSAMDDPNYVLDTWKGRNGWTPPLDGETIKAVSRAVREHVQGCFTKEGQLAQQVENASTIEEVQAITY